jgi:hypothetical protein
MADAQTSEDIDQTAAKLRANDPPRDTSPPPSPQDALGVNTAPPPALVKGLQKINSRQLASDRAISGEMRANYKTDRERLQEEYAAEQVKDIKPWDAQAESKKRESDPITEFASLGSVFGILASAFTHAPMTNALNASAAAIDAINANNAEDYKRAHEAWKENTDAAFKRADMEHRRFTDAVTLMKENMAAGLSMAKLNAIESGDQKAQLYLENGMIPEWDDLMTKRAETKSKTADAALKQAKDMAIMRDRMDLIAKYKSDFAAAHDGREPSETELQHAMPQINKQWMQETSPYRTTSGVNGMIEQRTQAYYDDPDSPTHGNFIASQDRALKKIKGEASAKTKTLAEEYKDKAVAEFTAAHGGQEPSAAEYKKIVEAAPKPQTVKQFTSAESSRIADAPTLMRDLQVMNTLMDQGTGAFTGLMKQVGAEYLGVNDPVGLFNAARKSAEAAATAMAAQGSRSVIALKAQLDTIPEVKRASDFGHKQASLKMGELRDETQSYANTMEAGGKKIDADNLDRLAKMGVYPESDKEKNPLLKLAKDPPALSDDELGLLTRLGPSYPPDVQAKIRAERNRRAIEWDKLHGHAQ